MFTQIAKGRLPTNLYYFAKRSLKDQPTRKEGTGPKQRQEAHTSITEATKGQITLCAVILLNIEEWNGEDETFQRLASGPENFWISQGIY